MCEICYGRGVPVEVDDLFKVVLSALETKTETVVRQRQALIDNERQWSEVIARIRYYLAQYNNRSVETVAALEALQQDMEHIARGRFPAEDSADQCAMTPEN